MTGLFETVLRLSIAGGLTVLAVFLLEAPLRNRLPKTWLFCLYAAAVLRFMIPVSFTLPFNLLRHDILPAPTAAVVQTVTADEAAKDLSYDLPPSQSGPSNIILSAPASFDKHAGALIQFIKPGEKKEAV